MAINTVGELRKALAAEGLRWTVNERLPDNQLLVRPHLGALTDQMPRAANLPRVDVAKMVAAMPPVNVSLVNHLVEIGVLKAQVIENRLPVIPHPSIPPAAGGPAVVPVDWRNRWGTNWITQIRDQDPCEACWAFGATALVESMVRIEHCVWCVRSEGDVHDGMGTKCGDCGNAGAALDWIKTNGISDSPCYAWPAPGNRSSSYFNPAPGGCGGGSMVAPNYHTCSDRSGRTVRIGGYTNLGNVNDEKNWIDQVGPLVVGFDVYNDFQWWSGSSPYIQSKSATYLGGHVMLAVGYDDNLNCWIVKNSWGANLGNQGYWLIGYGQCNIDTYGKLGLQESNPDPWTKRRLHSGGIVESGDGATHRNFELVALINGTQVAHWWRDNTASGYPWARAEVFANDVNSRPTLTETTYNRNFELVYVTTGNRLHHWYFDQTGGQWNDGGVFGPTDAATACTPGFIESNYGPGNFEVVVSTQDGKLNHWWRDTAFQWHDGGRFASNILSSAPTLIQSTYGQIGNLELACLLNTHQMQHWWRDDDHGNVWNAGPVFGSNISSPPCMIQGQYGMSNESATGNFELCAATTAGTVQHWWRDNSSSSEPWQMSATFGHNVVFVVALIEGSFGFNLEVIVHRSDGELQHYWRDGAGWHEGAVIGISL